MSILLDELILMRGELCARVKTLDVDIARLTLEKENVRDILKQVQRMIDERQGLGIMKNGVTKQELVASLAETLRMTRNEVLDLTLDDDATVTIHYTNVVEQKVNIECDSGIAIIRDVARAIS